MICCQKWCCFKRRHVSVNLSLINKKNKTYLGLQDVYKRWLCTIPCIFLGISPRQYEAISVQPLQWQEALQRRERKTRKRCFVHTRASGDASFCDFLIVALNSCSGERNTKVSVAFQVSLNLFKFYRTLTTTKNNMAAHRGMLWPHHYRGVGREISITWSYHFPDQGVDIWSGVPFYLFSWRKCFK